MFNIYFRPKKNYVAKVDSNKNLTLYHPVYDNVDEPMFILPFIILWLLMFGFVLTTTYDILLTLLIPAITVGLLSFMFFSFKRKNGNSVDLGYRVYKPDSIDSKDWNNIVLGMVMNAKMDDSGIKWFSFRDARKLTKIIKNAENTEKQNYTDEVVQDSMKRFDAYIEDQLIKNREIVK